jgi:hypothetical protein
VQVHCAVFPQVYHTDGYNYGLPQDLPTPRGMASTPQSVANVVCRSVRDSSADRIKVCVRKRPMTTREVNANDQDVVTVQGPRSVVVEELKTSVDTKKYVQQVIYYLSV